MKILNEIEDFRNKPIELDEQNIKAIHLIFNTYSDRSPEQLKSIFNKEKIIKEGLSWKPVSNAIAAKERGLTAEEYQNEITSALKIARNSFADVLSQAIHPK